MQTISCLFSSTHAFWLQSCQSQMAHLWCFSCLCCLLLTTQTSGSARFTLRWFLPFWNIHVCSSATVQWCCQINVDFPKKHCSSHQTPLSAFILNKTPKILVQFSVKVYMWSWHILHSIFFHLLNLLLCSFQQEAILDIKRIRVSYLRTWFIPDVIAAFPIGYILLFAVIMSRLLRQETVNNVLLYFSVHWAAMNFLLSIIRDFFQYPALSFTYAARWCFTDDFTEEKK